MERPRLNDVEARVLGVLVEKSFTTPDHYPLSLNALRNGCNQKSNRDPVTSYVEAEVVVGLQGLVPKHLAGKVVEAGSRVEKYRHTASDALGVKPRELAVLAELLMRGPQAQGELRARVHRMVPTATLPELQEALDDLIAAGLVRRAAPAPGSRAPRFAQLLGPDLHAESGSGASTEAAEPEPTAPRPAPSPPPLREESPGLEDRVASLERDVRALREALEELQTRPS